MEQWRSQLRSLDPFKAEHRPSPYNLQIVDRIGDETEDVKKIKEIEIRKDTFHKLGYVQSIDLILLLLGVLQSHNDLRSIFA